MTEVIDEVTEEAAEQVTEPAAVDDAVVLSPAQQREHEHYEAIKLRTQAVCSARTLWAAAKDRASALKKEFDALTTELLDFTRGGLDLQQKLPLTDEPPASDAPPVASDAWREVEVGELEIPDSLAAKLVEHGLHTLGELSDFWKARRELTELKGIGGAKQDLVADAFAKYGQEHPEVFGEPAAPAEPAPASEEAGADEENDEEEDWEEDLG